MTSIEQALRELRDIARVVHSLGATTGNQWTRLACATLRADAALASLEAAKQEPLTDAQSMVDFARGYAAGERVALANWTEDASNYGGALNAAAWVFIETCPEKSTLLFNHCKPALREAILKYAELVAAAPSPGSGT